MHGLLSQWIFFATALLAALPAHSNCHFDHQLVVLPETQYRQFEMMLKHPAVQKEIGAKWLDDPSGSDMKGFLYFDDLTYLEIWNANRSPAVGYQEACRISDRAKFDQMAAQYGKIAIEAPDAFSVFGLYTGVAGLPYGGAGNPFGGLFYIWYPNTPPRERSNLKYGIVKIVKSVPTGAFEELIGEYRRAGLSMNCSALLSNPNTVTATDTFGLQRIVTRAPLGSLGNILSVEFTRQGNSTLQTPFLELGPGVGKIIFP